ncbi:MAG: hypothetical protein ACI8PZ_005065 [Myxococcota bacterium]
MRGARWTWGAHALAAALGTVMLSLGPLGEWVPTETGREWVAQGYGFLPYMFEDAWALLAGTAAVLAVLGAFTFRASWTGESAESDP